MRRLWPFFSLVTLVLALLGLAQTGRGHTLLKEAGLTEPPASYTALSFTRPTSLPTRLTSKRIALAMPFMIRNISTRQRVYRWSIVVMCHSISRQVAHGKLSLNANQQMVVDNSLSTSCVGGRLHVVVRLTSPAESIDFWSTCWLGKGRSS